MRDKLNRYFDILFILTKKELFLKYRNTLLGYAWILLNPLLLAAVYYFVFHLILGINIKGYLFYLIIGVLVWNSITSSLIYGVNSFISNAPFIKKLPIPKSTIPISTVLANQIPYFIILCFLGLTTFDVKVIVWLLILQLLQATLVIGMALALSPINAIVRDLGNLLNFLLNIMFYLTPVVYKPEMIPAKFKILLFINPFALIVTSWHSLLMDKKILWKSLALLITFDIIFLIIGLFVFFKLSDLIAEVL